MWRQTSMTDCSPLAQMFIYGVSIYPPQWNENKSDDWSVSFHPIDSFVCQSGAISQRMQIMLAVKKKGLSTETCIFKYEATQIWGALGYNYRSNQNGPKVSLTQLCHCVFLPRSMLPTYLLPGSNVFFKIQTCVVKWQTTNYWLLILVGLGT